MLKVPKSRSRCEDISQQRQSPDELQAPPLLAQLTSILVSIGSDVGIWFILVPSERVGPIISIAALVAGAFGGYYLTISCLSRLFTGSWVKYPKMVKNIDMSD